VPQHVVLEARHHLAAEVPYAHVTVAKSKEGLVLVEEDEGGGGHEARLGHVYDRRALVRVRVRVRLRVRVRVSP